MTRDRKRIRAQQSWKVSGIRSLYQAASDYQKDEEREDYISSDLENIMEFDEAAAQMANAIEDLTEDAAASIHFMCDAIIKVEKTGTFQKVCKNTPISQL